MTILQRAATKVAQSATPYSFASDNWSGIHPEVLAAIAAANTGQAPSYGGDEWTARFRERMKTLIHEDVEAFPVLNGTGANVLALQAALPRWGAVICARTAHVAADETGAPEKTGGLKLFTVDTPDGKLTPEIVDQEAWGWGDTHRAQPLAVSIAQVTELGTCYTPNEIRALADHAHARGMLLHVDGSRLTNAATHLGVSLAALTSEVGVDVLSLGGTKNGLLGAEAVIVLRPGATPGMEFLRKVDLQLASKMRFVSAQLLALYEGDLWERAASHANAMATRLAEGMRKLASSGAVPGLEIVYPVESNAVFATLSPEVENRLQGRFTLGSWPTVPNLFRFMCAYDTPVEEVDAVLEALSA
ncbi:threonine aldolase [Rhodococcus sp. LBL1]|nr:threonine aldolase [Rhodococcus sp. LBL1]MDH6684225.1 threonine aldolase [Rhodococcus sp. LBL2]